MTNQKMVHAFLVSHWCVGMSSPPACVSFRESCQLSPVILVFTVVQLMYMNRYIRDVHMCKGVYSSVFIMKNGLLPSLAGGSERPHADQYAVSTTAMGMGGPAQRAHHDRSASGSTLTLGSVRKCEL
jgi:hypothetical protein